MDKSQNGQLRLGETYIIATIESWPVAVCWRPEGGLITRAKPLRTTISREGCGGGAGSAGHRSFVPKFLSFVLTPRPVPTLWINCPSQVALYCVISYHGQHAFKVPHNSC